MIDPLSALPNAAAEARRAGEQWLDLTAHASVSEKIVSLGFLVLARERLAEKRVVTLAHDLISAIWSYMDRIGQERDAAFVLLKATEGHTCGVLGPCKGNCR